MKAIVINRFGDENVFEAADIAVPEIKKDDILIEVVSASVNPIDYKQRHGNHKFIFGSPFPIVLGYDIAGTVIKTGSNVKEFVKGDKVCGVLNNKYGGGLSQFAKGNKNCFVKIPDKINHLNTAALPLTGLTALQALRDKADLRKDQTILIIGAAGGLGHFTLQIANIIGARTIALSSLRHKPFLEQIGFSEFIDYHQTDILDSDKNYDVIFDTVGKYTFLKCKHLLKPNGIYINSLPRPKILVHKFLSLFTKSKKVKTLLMKHSSKDLNQLISWIVEGKLKIYIDKEYSINEMAQAHKYSEEGHSEGKILIKYDWQ